jgi:hypothetical protein
MQDPGGGGGFPPTPDTICGQIASLGGPGGPIPADVYVSLTYGTSTAWTYTDSNGVFQFQEGNNGFVPMMPNTGPYVLMVNADPWDNWLPDYHWGQWYGWVFTDNNGWALVFPHLQPAAQVNVTYAALYSNTQFATLEYGIQSESSFSHSVSFNVLNTGISIGYTQSSTASADFSVTGVSCYRIAQHWYANSYYDSTIPGVTKTGLSVQVPQTLFFNYPTTEYVNPSTLTANYKDFGAGEGGQTSQKYDYQESGSYTWGVNGAPFAIVFSAWSQVLTIDETVTTSGTNDLSFSVSVPSGSPFINFRAYCPSNFNPKADPSIGTGGFELHVWDMSGYG